MRVIWKMTLDMDSESFISKWPEDISEYMKASGTKTRGVATVHRLTIMNR